MGNVVPDLITESEQASYSWSAKERFWLWVVAALGVIVYGWLLTRSWVGRDQLILLQLGENFARTGTLDPVAKGMSGGGMIPGSLLQLLIGLPLLVWQDYRAPLVLIGIFNILAAIVIYHVAKRELPSRVAAIYLVLYWISPWHISHAAMLWEPAYLFLLAALHFWASSKLATSKHFLASASIGIVLLTTPQLHGSFIFLWILTALLLWKKQLHVHWTGFVAGAILGSLTFIPTIVAAFSGTLPSSLPSEGFIGKGFLYVFPFLKGFLYWLRLPSLDLAIKETIYLQRGWAISAADHIVVILLRILQGFAIASIAISALAVWWYVKRMRAKDDRPHYTWAERYAGYSFIALMISAGLSPITLQSWHVIIALHAAVIPIAVWLGRSKEKGRLVRFYVPRYVGLSLILLIVTGLGKPSFRKTEYPPELIHMPSVRPLLPSLADTSRSQP